MPDRLASNSLLAKLDTQPRVRDFLARAVASGRASHAYLFLGAPGSGKLDAAWALAQALLCSSAPAADTAPVAAEGSSNASHNGNNSEESQSFSSCATSSPLPRHPAAVVNPGACGACDNCSRVARRTHRMCTITPPSPRRATSSRRRASCSRTWRSRHPRPLQGLHHRPRRATARQHRKRAAQDPRGAAGERDVHPAGHQP